MKKFFASNCFKRAIRTFLQTSVGYIATNLTVYLTGIDYADKNVVRDAFIGLAVASVSAGLAAVMNRREEVNTDE